jgi:hypothetical protein
MKLIYRGTTYDYDPAQAQADHRTQRTAPYDLIYRGSTYRFDLSNASIAMIEPRSYELMYRGNTYQVTRNKFAEMTAITCSTNFFQSQILKTHAATPKLDGQHLR